MKGKLKMEIPASTTRSRKSFRFPSFCRSVCKGPLTTRVGTDISANPLKKDAYPWPQYTLLYPYLVLLPAFYPPLHARDQTILPAPGWYESVSEFLSGVRAEYHY